MEKKIFETRKDGYLISTDHNLLQIATIQSFLAQSYWANARSLEIITRSVENSLCFGMYQEDRQIGFARVVTDYATYAWLCDVFIGEDYRGHRLGVWLVGTVISHPELQGLRRWVLATRDAHELYRKFGFGEITKPERLMERFDPNV